MSIGPLVTTVRALTRPLLDDDAGTVAHVVWRDGQLVDTRGNAWTQNGTVPQVARTAGLPAGAGPFSDANYYTLGTGSDVLDFAGDFSACLVMIQAATFAATTVMMNGAYYASGWWINTDAATHSYAFIQSVPGMAYSKYGNAALIDGAVNVLCFGRAGLTGLYKLNLHVLATVAVPSITPGSSYPVYLGVNSPGIEGFNGTILEAWFSTATPSDTLFTALMQQVKQRLGITEW